MAKRVLHWFRRDLRVADNTALRRACERADEVMPVFILEEKFFSRRDTGAACVSTLLDSLRALDAELAKRGSRLILRRGRAAEEVPKLVHETRAEMVFLNRSYAPWEMERDKEVRKRLFEQKIPCEIFKDEVLNEPNEVLNQQGAPYTIFTAYRNAALAKMVEAPCAAPKRIVAPQYFSNPIPTLASLHLHTSQQVPPGGEALAQRQLKNFLEKKLARYASERDYPAAAATSRLSSFLRWGNVSIRAVLFAALGQKPTLPAAGKRSVELFHSELVWRDFFMQILFHFPHVEHGSFRKNFDGLAWENDEKKFQAWCEGRTGYPIVDAALRELNTTAWMHNRARMIVASFLTKDLLIDWRWGEQYFLRQLADADIALNNGNWQWAAGTGCDAQPFFRIFNPVLQSKRYDPQGTYIRRFVPELSRVPTPFIHAPWTMPPILQKELQVRIGKDYPAPIVDHAEQREKAIRLYEEASAKGTR